MIRLVRNIRLMHCLYKLENTGCTVKAHHSDSGKIKSYTCTGKNDLRQNFKLYIHRNGSVSVKHNHKGHPVMPSSKVQKILQKSLPKFHYKHDK